MFYHQVKKIAGNQSSHQSDVHFQNELNNKFSQLNNNELRWFHERFNCTRCHELMSSLAWAASNSKHPSVSYGNKDIGKAYIQLQTIIYNAASTLSFEISKRQITLDEINYPTNIDEDTKLSYWGFKRIRKQARDLCDGRLVLLDQNDSFFEQTSNPSSHNQSLFNN